MKLVRAGEASFALLWEKLLEQDELGYPLLRGLDVAYCTAYMRESRFEDVSFLIEESQSPSLGVRMAVRTHPDGRRDISGFGRPIGYFESNMTDAGRREGAICLLRDEMNRLVETTGCTSIVYEELGSALSPIGRYLMDRGAKAIPRFAQVIDLTQSETLLRQQIRKSYKSLINWGGGKI